MLHHLQMQMVEDEKGLKSVTDGREDSQEPADASSPIKQCQFFAFEEMTSPEKREGEQMSGSEHH